MFKKWHTDGGAQARAAYREAKKEVKQIVVKTKAEAFDEMYNNMETCEGMKRVYRIAKQRNKDAQDIQQVKMMKEEMAM